MWTVYLLSLKSINMNKAKISAPRVGLCSNRIVADLSDIDSNFKGCEADNGPGNVERRSAHCAGAGASHSGFGGHGASDTSDADEVSACKKTVASLVDMGKEARIEGSGGTSGDSPIVKGKSTEGRNGGSGGGVVWLAATDTIALERSTVAAEGHWARLDTYE